MSCMFEIREIFVDPKGKKYLSNRPQVSMGYLTIRLRARVFYEQNSQRGAAELTIARRKRGRVV